MRYNIHKKALCISMMCLLATASISGCSQKTSVDNDVLGYQGIVDIKNESDEIIETIKAEDLINDSQNSSENLKVTEAESGNLTSIDNQSESDSIANSEKETEATIPENPESLQNQEETTLAESTTPESDMKGLIAVAQVEKYVNVRTEPNAESGIIGKIYNNCAATILDEADCEDGKWYLMESGNVTGYIKAEFFVTGEEAEALRSEVGNTFGTVIVENLRVRSTPDLSDESNIISMMPMGTDVYIIEHDDNWAKIQTDDVNIGYVHVSCLELRTEFDVAISLEEEERQLQEKREAEERARKAEEEYKALIAKQEQESIDASIAASSESASIEEAYLAYLAQSRAEAEQAAAATPAPAPETPAPAPETPVPTPETPAPVPETPAPVPETTSPAVSQNDVNAALRSAIVAFAVQYEGCPYVHGGNSLDHGTDCSGFTKLVYQNFGYTIDRTPGGQSIQGRRIANSEIQPGDLVFYTRDTGAIGHVALYIGDGKIIHACNEKYGICIWNMYYREPAWCVTIIG